MTIEALLSSADGTDVEVDLRTERMRRIGDDQLLWVDVADPSDDDLETLAASLELRDEEVEALRSDLHDPGVTSLDRAVAVTLLWLDDAAGEQAVPLQTLAGAGWVITRHAGRLARLEERRRQITDGREIGLLRPVDFLLAVLDWHVEGFHAAAEDLERQVDRLDEEALRSDGDLLPRLVEMRRRIARVRRAAAVHHDVYSELSRPDFMPELEGEAEARFERAGDRLERATAAIAQVREMLIGVFDVHMTRTAQRTNDIMRVLTVASVILLPAVVLAGIMGMNFRVGFFDDPSFFWVVLGVMVAMAAVTIIVARWRGWL
jgi:Mg2+ and Co2+ transporter CorA